MPELSRAEAAAGVVAGSLPERLTPGDTGAANIAIFVEIGQIRVAKTVVRRGCGGTENRPGGVEKTVSTLEKTKVLTENSKVLTVFSKVLTVSIAAGEGGMQPFSDGPDRDCRVLCSPLQPSGLCRNDICRMRPRGGTERERPFPADGFFAG